MYTKNTESRLVNNLIYQLREQVIADRECQHSTQNSSIDCQDDIIEAKLRKLVKKTAIEHERTETDRIMRIAMKEDDMKIPYSNSKRYYSNGSVKGRLFGFMSTNNNKTSNDIEFTYNAFSQ